MSGEAVWVVFGDFGDYEGYSAPIAVFSTQAATEAFCADRGYAMWTRFIVDRVDPARETS